MLFSPPEKLIEKNQHPSIGRQDVGDELSKKTVRMHRESTDRFQRPQILD
jgi:hypothetical protein